MALHIALITSGQPGSNPRLVKEANALAARGYRVTVFYVFRTAWASEVDRQILADAQWRAVKVGGDPVTKPGVWFFTRLRRRLCAEISRLFPSMFFIERALCLPYQELLRAALASRADFFIAHNLGALPVAARAARITGVKYAFDAEDYHRGEFLSHELQQDWSRRVEERYFKGASYITAASPGIAAEYEKHFADLQFTVVRNCFPRSLQQAFQENLAEELRLFWFSQVVASGRGLEELIEAMNLLPDRPMALSLLGRLDEKYQKSLNESLRSKNHRIIFHESTTEDLLIKIAANQHIGLALERKELRNREVCQTNKLFIYALAGNAIIASDTEAQSQFIAEFPSIGTSYRLGDPKHLAEKLDSYFSNRNLLNEQRKAAWDLANTELNWEQEQERFVEVFSRTIAEAKN